MRTWARAALVACVPIAAGLLYLAAHGAPEPIVHDEFSYLLAADTFAHGRLANPAHPFWRHFQSVNVLVRPSFMSKYPPAQGLFLALGQVAAGRPLLGAILSVALAAAALHWMLLAFLPESWALAAGLLAASHPLPLYWLTNYWGGGVALLGGALFLGAWKRALDRPGPRPALALAAGLALLANSRPLEGALFSGPLLAVLLWKTRRRSRLLGPALAAGVALAGAWMALYDLRVTGSPWQLPYLLYEQTYNPAPLFVWQGGLRRVPDPGVKEIRDLWFDWNLARHQRQRTVSGFLGALGEKLADLDEAWLEPFPVKIFLALPLLGLCGATAFWLGMAGTVATAVTLTLLFYYPHYSAPLGGLFFLLVALGMRRAWRWRWGRPAVIATAAWCLGRSALFLGRKMENPKTAWSYFRRDAVERMKAMGGKHLVLVRYGPGASYHDDWVANGADIDLAPVVWAWRLGPEDDRRLADYYPDRAVWNLEVVPPRPVFKLARVAAP